MPEIATESNKLKEYRELVFKYARQLRERGVSKKEIAAVIYALLVIAPYVAEALFDPDKENDFDGASVGHIIEGCFFALAALIANFPNVLYFLWDFWTNKLTRLLNREMSRLEVAGLVAGAGLGAFAALAGITTAKDSLSKTVGKADWLIIVPFTFHVFLTRMFGISTLVKAVGDKISIWFNSQSTSRCCSSLTWTQAATRIAQIGLAVTVIGLLPPWMQLVNHGLLRGLNPMAATWIGGAVNETFYVISALVFIPRLLDYIHRLVVKGYSKVSISLLVGLTLAVAAMSGTAFMNLVGRQCQELSDVITSTLLAGEYNPYRVYWDTLIRPWLGIVALLGAALSNGSGMLGLFLALMVVNEESPGDYSVATETSPLLSGLGPPGSEHEMSDAVTDVDSADEDRITLNTGNGYDTFDTSFNKRVRPPMLQANGNGRSAFVTNGCSVNGAAIHANDGGLPVEGTRERPTVLSSVSPSPTTPPIHITPTVAEGRAGPARRTLTPAPVAVSANKRPNLPGRKSPELFQSQCPIQTTTAASGVCLL